MRAFFAIAALALSSSLTVAQTEAVHDNVARAVDTPKTGFARVARRHGGPKRLDKRNHEKRLLGLDLGKVVNGAPEGNVLPISIQVLSDGNKQTGLYLPIPVGQEQVTVDALKKRAFFLDLTRLLNIGPNADPTKPPININGAILSDNNLGTGITLPIDVGFGNNQLIDGNVQVLKKRLLGIDLSKIINGAPEGNLLPLNVQVFSDGNKNTGLYIPIPLGPNPNDTITVDVAKRSQEEFAHDLSKRAVDNVVTVPQGSVLGMPLGVNVELAQEISRFLGTLLGGVGLGKRDSIPGTFDLEKRRFTPDFAALEADLGNALKKRAVDNVATVPQGSVLGLPLYANVELARQLSNLVNGLLGGIGIRNLGKRDVPGHLNLFERSFIPNEQAILDMKKRAEETIVGGISLASLSKRTDALADKLQDVMKRSSIDDQHVHQEVARALAEMLEGLDMGVTRRRL
ncbi:hypothetical protein OIO90_003533 [Microbotryomycetes sp. JL221]|nr:hypothetical protein OIO90_003533 [Microbotryomycetes sp. JL221]